MHPEPSKGDTPLVTPRLTATQLEALQYLLQRAKIRNKGDGWTAQLERTAIDHLSPLIPRKS